MALIGEGRLAGWPERFAAERELAPEPGGPGGNVAEWLVRCIPRFECPDTELEGTYYFRWWTYRQALRATPVGHVVLEFLWQGRVTSPGEPSCVGARRAVFPGLVHRQG